MRAHPLTLLDDYNRAINLLRKICGHAASLSTDLASDHHRVLFSDECRAFAGRADLIFTLSEGFIANRQFARTGRRRLAKGGA
jgi:hypothetical protein